MPDSYFTPMDATSTLPGSLRFAAGPATVGPWSPALQHGGPPNALAVACAERAVRAETGRDDLVASRLSADFVGPVPVGTIDVRTRLVRAARSAALVDVMLSSGERDCLQARVWFVRAADTTAVAAPVSPAVAVPDVPTGLDTEFGYGASLEWRFVRGSMRTPGPGAVWVRAATGLVEGWTYSGLARAALIADSASGVSAELDWDEWSFVNVDLDVHLARPVRGEWLLMEAATQLGTDGAAVATSVLSDVHGPVGGGLQTLVVAPHRR